MLVRKITRIAGTCSLYLTIIALLGLFLPHITLIGIGQWLPDEYSLFKSFNEQGIMAAVHYVYKWCPNVFQIIILYVYYLAVSYFHNPLIIPILGLCWLAVIGSTLVGVGRYLHNRNEHGEWVLPYRLLLSLSMLCMFLLQFSIDEVFYWPAGAWKYATTLAAIIALFFSLADMPQADSRGRLLQSIALVIACTSSEMGAMFTIVFCGLTILPIKTDHGWQFPLKGSADWIAWIIPFLIAIATWVVMLFTSTRLGNSSEISPWITENNMSHHLGTSVGRGFIQFLVDMTTPIKSLKANGYYGYGWKGSYYKLIIKGVLAKLCFFMGFAACWKAAGASLQFSRRQLMFFVLALLGASYGTIVASNYQFGGFSGSRHECMRQSFFILAVAAMAVCALQKWNPTINIYWRPLIPLLLLIPVVCSFIHLGRLEALTKDYKNYSAIASARRNTWKSAEDSSRNDMVYYLAPSAYVSNSLMQLPPGYYWMDSATPEEIKKLKEMDFPGGKLPLNTNHTPSGALGGVMQYYQKTLVKVVQ